MQKIKETVLSLTLINYQIKDIATTIGLIALSIVAPAIFAHTPQNQWLTGIIVNATLFLAAYKLAPTNALFVAVLPSTVALMRGLLPLPMAFLIPYIIIANVLLIIIFGVMKKSLFAGIVFSSIVKFSFLYFISSLALEKFPIVLLTMLQWPQLFTALAGGLVAMTVIKIFHLEKVK